MDQVADPDRPRGEDVVIADTAFAAGQIVGLGILATVVSLAIRNQARKRRR
jgi:hypothetical protein